MNYRSHDELLFFFSYTVILLYEKVVSLSTNKSESENITQEEINLGFSLLYPINVKSKIKLGKIIIRAIRQNSEEESLLTNMHHSILHFRVNHLVNSACQNKMLCAFNLSQSLDLVVFPLFFEI